MCQFFAETPGLLIGKTSQKSFEVSTKWENSVSSEISAVPRAPGLGSDTSSDSWVVLSKSSSEFIFVSISRVATNPLSFMVICVYD